MPNLVKAIVSKKQLTLSPDIAADSGDRKVNQDNEFDVTVINESREFASFQLELSAVGTDPDSNVKWYTLDPEVCVKKPPGASTKFHVTITKPPIQVYDTTIELTLKVFSVEFSHIYTSQKLSLTIQKARKPLRLYLPVKDLKVYPGDELEIPVILYNLSQKATTVRLTISGLNLDWIASDKEQKFQIDAGDSYKTSFWCQPPKSPQTISQKYDFRVEAKSETASNPAREQGTLDVLPQGSVEVTCTPKIQQIPKFKNSPTDKHSKFATYELQFENRSNLPQNVNIQISDPQKKLCNLQIPEELSMSPGDIKHAYLVSKKRRPWLGFKRRFLFEIFPILTNPDPAARTTPISANPSSQILELHVLPIIPFWLQLFGGLLILLIMWLLRYNNPPIYHTRPVNSVRLIGIAGTVISGSNDQTIRRWQVDTSPLQDSSKLKYQGIINKREETNKGVRVIQQRPKPDHIIAAGLETGEIQLWDALSGKVEQTISKNKHQTDRVLDLDFTFDSYYLFSAHGSGYIRRWNVEKKSISGEAYLKLAIYSLAIAQSNNPPTNLVVVAGQRNKFYFWDWQYSSIYEMRYQWRDGAKTLGYQPIMGGSGQYIESLSTADRKNLLASADNEGYITLWNMNRIRQCIRNKQIELKEKPDRNLKEDGLGNKFIPLECNGAILDQWRNVRDGKPFPVRSAVLSQNGCYLASAGDDGRVMLWPLTKNLRSPEYQNGKIIAEFDDIRLNTIDIKAIDNHLLIATGDDFNRVRLYREEDNHANCQ
ncbi:MAG TPA: hypothetical protein V6D28_16090 [Leptolyngbyaceae cyanobacterium]